MALLGIYTLDCMETSSEDWEEAYRRTKRFVRRQITMMSPDVLKAFEGDIGITAKKFEGWVTAVLQII